MRPHDPQFANWHQDAQTVAAELAVAAGLLADQFDAVGAEQRERRGFCSDGSVFTIASLGRYLMHDPVHHLWDVDADVPICE